MEIKRLFSEHFHQLYRTLRYLDRDETDRTGEEIVNLMKQNIDQLNAFLSLLAYIDPRLPLIRCQEALGRFHADVVDLYLTYLEERLIGKEQILYDESQDINILLAIDEADQRSQYSKSLHDLYLNTIHATEEVVIEHLNALNEERLRSKIVEYFQHQGEVVLEHFERSDFDGLAILISEINDNFELLVKLSMPVEDEIILVEIREELKFLQDKMKYRMLYLDSIQRLLRHNFREASVDKDLRQKIGVLEKEITGERDHFESLTSSITQYLQKILWQEGEEPSLHSSVPPINLRDDYR